MSNKHIISEPSICLLFYPDGKFSSLFLTVIRVLTGALLGHFQDASCQLLVVVSVILLLDNILRINYNGPYDSEGLITQSRENYIARLLQLFFIGKIVTVDDEVRVVNLNPFLKPFSVISAVT